MRLYTVKHPVDRHLVVTFDKITIALSRLRKGKLLTYFY